MAIGIQRHPNYGKDLITLQKEARLSLSESVRMLLATLKMFGRIQAKVGLRKTAALFRDVKLRVREVLEGDALSEVRCTGISEPDLEERVERIALGQVMTRYLGMERAIAIRTALSEEIAPFFFPKLFPARGELESMPGGYLPNLRAFLESYARQNAHKSIQIGSIREETETGFKLIITSCNFALVSEIMGNPEICYWTTCVTDSYFFPVQAKEAGVEFARHGTIAEGYSVCDFCWRERGAV
jgi:hypothetical protein